MAGPARRVPFIGLTGGLGAGKSTALQVLAELGGATLSTDAVVHDLLATDEMRDLLVERFGEAVAPDGAVDRGLVAARVFEHPEDREWLEGLLWPRVGARVARWRSEVEAREPPPPVAVVETPLLFEAGMDGVYDYTVAIVADESIRAERAGRRGHEAVEERAGRQLTQEQKSQRADFTVRNDGTPAELRSQLSAVIERIGGNPAD